MWYKIKAIILVAIMITVGSLFPKTVLTYQDKILQGKVSKYDVNQIEFRTENEIFNILNNISNNNFYYSREIVNGMEKSKSEIYEKEKEFLNLINEYCIYDLKPENIEYHIESADLYIENTQNTMYSYKDGDLGNVAANSSGVSDSNNYKKTIKDQKKNTNESTATKMVIWNCNLEYKQGISVDMQIEDTTGLMCDFSIYCENAEDILIFENIDGFAKVLEKYYGVEAQINYESYGQIEILLSDKEYDKQLLIYMTLDKYGVYFNQ